MDNINYKHLEEHPDFKYLFYISEEEAINRLELHKDGAYNSLFIYENKIVGLYNLYLASLKENIVLNILDCSEFCKSKSDLINFFCSKWNDSDRNAVIREWYKNENPKQGYKKKLINIIAKTFKISTKTVERILK